MHVGNQDNPLTWTVFIEMNYSEPPHPPTGARRALHGLILLRLATLIPSDAHGISSLRLRVHQESVPEKRGSSPYLSTIGPAPLRFGAVPALPEPVPPPPVSTTPAPAAAPSEDFNAAAPLTTPAATSQPGAVTAPDAQPEPRETPAKDPPRILLDDVRPAVRPEEFLPYFQIPGSKQAGEFTLVVPVPRSAPASAPIAPSSATYTQTPK